MNAKTGRFLMTVTALSVALVSSGCATTPQQEPPSAAAPASTPAASTSTVPAVPTAEEDPVLVPASSADAFVASGLSRADYKKLRKEVRARWDAWTDNDSFFAQLDTLATKWGKPIGIIDLHDCRGSDLVGYGLSGVLYGNSLGCGVGDSATLESILQLATNRAERNELSPDDYYLVYLDHTK